MMSTLQLRGFSFSHRRPTTTLGPIGVRDGATLVAGVALYAVAALARFTPGLYPG